MSEPNPDQRSSEDEAAAPPSRTAWFRRTWVRVLGGTGTIALAVIAFLVGNAIQDGLNSLGPALRVTVADQSACSFVAPLTGPAVADPTMLEYKPGDFFSRQHCEKRLAELHGARDRLNLRLFITPTGSDALLLTDVTLKVRKRTTTMGGADYIPVGTGGGDMTMNIAMDAEKSPAIQKITTYLPSSFTPETTSSIKDIMPQPGASQSDPLVVDLDIYGSREYTTFDIEIHWTSGKTSGIQLLDNGGAGYTVAGKAGLPVFNGFDNNSWQPGAF